MDGLEWWTVYVLTKLFASKEANAKKTLQPVQEQFIMTVDTFF